MLDSHKTIDVVAQILGQSTVEVMQRSSGSSAQFANYLQKIPSVNLKPDVSCFIQFEGDYRGLLVMNFPQETALEYYRASMIHMGMPPEEVSENYISDQVLDSVGEMVNQLIGKFRQKMQTKYGFFATNRRPKPLEIVDSILLSIQGVPNDDMERCRRLSFRFMDKFPFTIEFFLEKTEFIPVPPAP
jgi:CheY-specific phosphatase CheX